MRDQWTSLKVDEHVPYSNTPQNIPGRWKQKGRVFWVCDSRPKMSAAQDAEAEGRLGCLVPSLVPSNFLHKESQHELLDIFHCRLVWKVLRSDICCAQCTCRTRHSSKGGNDGITALVTINDNRLILLLCFYWIQLSWVKSEVNITMIDLDSEDWRSSGQLPGACASDILVRRKQLPGLELHSMWCWLQGPFFVHQRVQRVAGHPWL